MLITLIELISKSSEGFFFLAKVKKYSVIFLTSYTMDTPLDLSAYDLGCIRSHPEFGVQNYPNNLDCSWVFEMTASEVLKLEFVDESEVENHSECSNDYINLSAEPVGNSGSLSKTTCGDYDGCLKMYIKMLKLRHSP